MTISINKPEPISLAAVALALGALLLGGCAQLPIERVERDLRQQLPASIAADTTWRRDANANAAASSRIATLLAEGVSGDEAVQIGLLASPDLQLQLEQLGLARAAWLDATQLSNPVFGWSRRTLAGGTGVNLEYSVAQDLLNLAQWPQRRKAADIDLNAARFEAARAVVQFAGELRQQYWRTVASQQLLVLEQQRAEVGQLMFELAERFHTAGNLSLMQREEQRDRSLGARAAMLEAAAESQRQRQQLLRLLALSGTHDDLTLSEDLPAVPANDPVLAALEPAALQARVDLQAARARLQAELARLAKTRQWRLLPELTANYSSERDTDGQRVRGPAVEIGLPLLNTQQAAVAEADVQARIALRRTESLALDIRQQLRGAHADLLLARQRLQMWQEQALPARAAIVENSTREFFYMLRGPWDPLLAKQELIDAQIAVVTAQRDYWLARTALAEAAGDWTLATVVTTSEERK